MLDAKKIKENLSNEQIIEFMYFLGAKEHIDREDYIIFPTICHNSLNKEASLKLYYYENKKIFVCYTECNDTFDIYGLILKVAEVNDIFLPYGNNFYGALEYLTGFFNLKNTQEFKKRDNYIVIRDKYKKKNYDIVLNSYNPIVLEVFHKQYTPEWLNEGITKETMDKYNISYSILENKIIIPHYDVNGRLVGIRGRDLNEDYVAKYMPMYVENKLYSHQLSFNLYGLNNNRENIRKVKTAIIFEGEKSVCKAESLLDINYSVACCGSKFNRFQINLLLKYCGIKEIIIAFDKEYDNHTSLAAKAYFSKLYALGETYSRDCDVSFMYDTKNLLEEKDSPIDKGIEVFNQLLDRRVFIGKEYI